MKYLALLLLLITSCTDNNTLSNIEKARARTKARIAANKIPLKPIQLSYEKSLDLILVDTDFNSTISGILQKDAKGNRYEAIYWDTNNNSYYIVSNTYLFYYPITVSNTNFVYTIDETKQFEPVLDSLQKEIFPDTKAPLLYIGDLSSPLERVFLDPTNQVYYIKRLTFFDTSIYTSYKENNRVTNTNSSPVYPVISFDISLWDNKTLLITTEFTNTDNQLFVVPSYLVNELPILYYSD